MRTVRVAAQGPSAPALSPRQLGQYLPLVHRLARAFQRRSGAELDDLVQVGCIGLLRAAQRYDPGLGFTFEAYASRLIAGELAHFQRDLLHLVRPPRDLVELRPAIRTAIARLTQSQHKEPTAREIACELGLSADKVSEVLALDRRLKPVSLDAMLPGAPDEKALELADPHIPALCLEERILLQEALDRLRPSFRIVIDLCYFQDLSQQEASRNLGISQAQVSRRLRLALKELRRHVAGKEAPHVG